jgi:glucose-1-phosphate adenylyltransferase
MKILAFVLAGGEGRRLRPLTADRAKPAVRFAGDYRIIDFALANLVNSLAAPIYVLAQYKPDALIEHLRAAWCPHWPVRVRLPAMAKGYGGTADAVYRNLELIERHRPHAVAVFAADHVYRMDVRQMARFHAARDADVTVAAIVVPVETAGAFGIMAVNSDGVIEEFQEKPAAPRAVPGNPGLACASMGNYLFKPHSLTALLEQTIGRDGTDFGRHILPALPGSGYRALAYDFARNRVPGVRDYEEPAYWRDVGTLEALDEARRDVAGARPRLDLRNRAWPIRRDLGRRVLDLPTMGTSTFASRHHHLKETHHA